MYKFLTIVEKKAVRIRRAYQRFMLGTDMPGKYRLVTLTTSEQYDGDFHHDWRRLLWRMRKRGIPRHYFAVKEFNKKHTCKHLHIAMRLSWIDFNILRYLWSDITGSQWVHVDKITTHRHMARYLCKYLVKANDTEPGQRSFWYSYEWIYRKFARFSKDMFKLNSPLDLPMHKLFHSIRDQPSRVALMNSELSNAFEFYQVSPGYPVVSLVQYPMPSN